MAISIVDVCDTLTPRHASVPVTSTATRRLPVTVLAAALIGVVEAIALLAAALTGLDGVLSAPGLPGWLMAVGLVVLAAWIVLCAGSGVALLDGTGRSLLMGVSCGELALVAGLLVVATATPFANPAWLQLAALGLLALAVPVGKLLLASAPSAARWVAAGPRARVRRPDPVRTHRLLATVTLGVIGASLCGVALLTPVADDATGDPASAVVTRP